MRRVAHNDETKTQDIRSLRPAGRSVRGLTVLFSPDPDAAKSLTAFPLLSELTIGRAVRDDVTISLDDQGLSRLHVTFEPAAGGATVTDNGSKNGTFVNGIRVEQSHLRDGDVVRIGDTLLEVGTIDPSARPPADDGTRDGLIGGSEAFSQLLKTVDRVATQPAGVLILGESGSGKELLSRRIHRKSGRHGDLVALNCAALPPNLVESHLFGHVRGAFTGATTNVNGAFRDADRGTLLLDEVGELPLELQAKLLRALDSGEVTPVGSSSPRRVDVRVVAATNVDLRTAVAQGAFRGDLYARIATFVVDVPPLRARRWDIPRLAMRFLATAAEGRDFTLTSEFMEALVLHDWPLNVRELRSAMQRIAVLAEDDVLTASHLHDALDRLAPSENAGGTEGPAEIGDGLEVRAPRGGPEREHLEEALQRAGGNVSEVARHFGVDRRTVYRWMKTRGLR